MDIKQLRYYVTVVEQGSLTRASRLLNITQPALSRQIRLLEVRLRLNLLTRTGRGVTPTDAGKQLLQHARNILERVDIAEEDMKSAHGALSGHVVLGMPPSVSRVLTLPIVNEFHKRFLEASLSISEGSSSSLQEWLHSGKVDIALLYKPEPSADIDTIPLMREDLYLIHASSDDPITPKALKLRDVASLPLIIPRKPHEIRMLVEKNMAELGCRPNILLEVDGVAAILDILADSQGYAILPLYAVSLYAKPEDYVFQRIVEPNLESMMAIGTSSNRAVTLTQQAALVLIREVCDKVLIPRVRKQIDLSFPHIRSE